MNLVTQYNLRTDGRALKTIKEQNLEEQNLEEQNFEEQNLKEQSDKALA